MDLAQKINRLRAQNEARKKKNLRFGSESDDARQGNRAAKLVIEYFMTHNPPKSLTPVNAHLNRQGILSKHRREVLDISRSASYLPEPPSTDFGDETSRRETLGERLRAFERVMVAVLIIALSMLFSSKRESLALPTW